jgi:hypothetical protein
VDPMTLGRKGTDHNVGVPAKWIAHGLRDLLAMASCQFASGRSPADFQHTPDSGRAEIRAIAVVGHVKLAQATLQRKVRTITA